MFRPTGTGFFRLKVGDVQFADLAFPLAASAGSKHLVKSVSSNIDAIAELNAVERRVPGETVIALPSAERLTGALLDRLTHHVHILEMNGDSYRLAHSKRRSRRPRPDAAHEASASD